MPLNGHFDPVAANHGSKTGRFLTLYDRGVWPNQIIADPNYENKIGEYSYNGMLYWIDGGKRTIEQIDYIGNNHKVSGLKIRIKRGLAEVLRKKI